MSRTTRTNLVPSIAGFATAAIALWCGSAQPLAAQDALAQVAAGKPVTYVSLAGNPSTNSTDSNTPATTVKSVVDLQPPISCKVDSKGVLSDCRINAGYTLNDVANWFQDDHDRTLHLAVNSLTLAKKLERSFESCVDQKATK